MQCSNCGAHNREGSAFCRECGQPLDAPSSSPSPRSGRKRGILVGGIVVIVVLLVTAFAVADPMHVFPWTQSQESAESDDGSAGPTIFVSAIDDEVQAAVDDAAQIARLAYTATNDEEARKQVYTDVYDTIAKLAEDQTVIKNALEGASDEEAITLQRYQAAIANTQRALLAENQFSNAMESAREKYDYTTTSGIERAYEAYNEAYKAVKALDVPDFYKQVLDDYAENGLKPMSMEMETLYYAVATADTDLGIRTLASYEAQELMDWTNTKEHQSIDFMVKTIDEQYKESEAVLTSSVLDAYQIEAEVEDVLSPNLYPSMDSIANIYVKARDQKSDITIRVEVVGFTQVWEERASLNQGINLFRIKPAVLLPDKLGDLSKGKTTQVEIAITDNKTKEVLFKKSSPIRLRSIYALDWIDDEFGVTSAFNVLAWMRPTCEEVDAINRVASDYMSSWFEGASMAGYHYGYNPVATLLQVAAIQSAISDAGVVYQMDSYSLTGGQNILTPDKVIQKKQGICIETSLLMASCLKRLEMHPMLIVTPGHAQVAVETYQGSGNYFLIETTILPYKVDTQYDYTSMEFYNGLLASQTVEGNATEWATYLESCKSQAYLDIGDELGGCFVIDCNLMDDGYLELQGLEV